MVEGVKNAEIYALSSTEPLQVETDNHALIFTDYVAKGPLSAYALSAIAHIPVEIRHIPGKTNIVADVLSRYQMVGKDELSVTGYGTALTMLLQRLREDIKSARNVWVYAHSSD